MPQPAIRPQAPPFPPIRRERLSTLQVNLGYRCNQACVHCHVDAGPKRTEEMDREIIDEVIAFLTEAAVPTLDITGGAPELHPHFRDLVRSARALGVHVIDRCNLTILEEPGQEGLCAFLAGQGVEVTASLPCYLEDNVDAQRGKGVFAASLRALKRLNAEGYGRAGSGLVLNLVYNPQGARLPPPQAALEADYRRRLWCDHGIVFNSLFVLVNMPIARFARTLAARGEYRQYLELLRAAHRDENLGSVMCRTLVSVDWQGRVYDCDFNQMLGIPLPNDGRPTRLRDLVGRRLAGRSIAAGEHCYGCTAGQGSSCGGALQ